jgi:REP-associated tyrosine transposase
VRSGGTAPTTRFPNKLKRLPYVFQAYDPPLYFVTICTWKRLELLASQAVQISFIEYCQNNLERGITVGRYVLMPDHLPLFVRIPRQLRLSNFVRLMKQYLSKELKAQGHPAPHWQPGFFDHLIRHSESYVQKWGYVRENPLRAGLGENWPFQGEVAHIDVV